MDIVYPDHHEARELRALARAVVRKAWRRGRASERFHGYRLRAMRKGDHVTFTLFQNQQVLGSAQINPHADA